MNIVAEAIDMIIATGAARRLAANSVAVENGPNIVARITLGYPRVEGVKTLARLLESKPDCRWCYDGDACVLGFERDTDAALFKLML